MGAKSGTMDNYKMIRKLVDFVNQNGESVMVDYDLETCMFEQIGDLFNGQPSEEYPPHLNQQDLGTHTNIHKFRKHFGQQQELNSSGVNIRDTKNVGEHITINDMRDFQSYFDASNNVVSDNVITKLFDE
jgi:hypothetical protein